ncbi:hypothetical protein SO694_00107012 [Aureococcus anophagefferens]|uniref:Uncharacterized protein n=1 Tax=Aureococcus anophagefferens TaxID=44056 RepID=A0ABR1FMK0_AURAN
MAALGAYKVKGKKGTICRAGVETDTAEVCVLKKDARRPVRGCWVSLKTLVKVDDESLNFPKARTGGKNVKPADWPMVNVPGDLIETCQKWLCLFKSLDECKFQAKPLPRWFLPSPPATQRSYFDSMGALSPPANPSGFKKPLIGPRCGDALPPADSLPPSTPARYRAAAVVCGAGAPACFVDGLIADDDPVYASVWKDRGLPAAVKCVFDPWSGAMLPVASSFVNGAGKAAARGVDLRLFYDDGAEAVQGCLRFGPGAQGGRDASLIDETYRVEAVCRLPEKGDEDDDDDDDLGKAVLFSDTGMKQRPVA